DCSKDNTLKIASDYPCKLISLKNNHGPAFCRNIGVKKSSGDILVFTDSDCILEHNFIKNIRLAFLKNNSEAIMGKLIIMPSNLLGDSISALGFPAGGSIGFEKIWYVDSNGFTKSLSTCNTAIKKELFLKIGGFDETFPYAGGEDSFFAYNLVKSNSRIRYCKDIVAYHPARNSITDFVSWQFKRGISSFIFSKKISDKKHFLSLRIWSTKNIIKHWYKDFKFPLIFFLLFTSFAIQAIGFIYAKHNRKYHECFNNKSALAR
ncbi:MAG: glycosyltransferase, partial [Desulfobacterales bacterium]|nr:glycosyltransferase [Desulfobacterales bacterium]